MPNEFKRNNEVQFWQASMRAALFNGVTETDIVAIMEAIKKKAKAGDLKAADFLFRWTMGPLPTVHVRETHVTTDDGQKIIDVDGGRQHSDPSPDEIAAKTLRIREGRDDRKRGLLG